MQDGTTRPAATPDSLIDPCFHLIGCQRHCYSSRLPLVKKPLKEIKSITVEIKVQGGKYKIPLKSVHAASPPDVLFLTKEAMEEYYACRGIPVPAPVSMGEIEYEDD